MNKIKTYNYKTDLINKIRKYGDNRFNLHSKRIAYLECLLKSYEDTAKEIHYTLQDCYDKNEKEKFENLVWLLCASRKITEHEKNELFEISKNWDFYKNNFPKGKIKYGGLGF